MVFALFGVSAPVFWLAYLFLYIFWFKLGWAPPSGIPIGEIGPGRRCCTGRFILPWIVLAMTFAAFYARMVRGNLIETMGEDYIRTARAKGLSEKRVIYKHGLRAALTPVVTMFGLDLAFLLGGAFITETVFDLPGRRPVRGAEHLPERLPRRDGRHAVRRRSSSRSRTCASTSPTRSSTRRREVQRRWRNRSSRSRTSRCTSPPRTAW